MHFFVVANLGNIELNSEDVSDAVIGLLDKYDYGNEEYFEVDEELVDHSTIVYWLEQAVKQELIDERWIKTDNDDDRIRYYRSDEILRAVNAVNDTFPLLGPDADHTNDQAIYYDVDRDVYYSYESSNPNGRFDYYTIGGRWASTLIAKRNITYTHDQGLVIGDYAPILEFEDTEHLTKSANHAGLGSAARKKDIDFVCMEYTTKKEALKSWEYVQEHPSQAVIQGCRETDTKDSYIDRVSKFIPAAYVSELGWVDEPTESWLEDVKDYDVLVIIDCHI